MPRRILSDAMWKRLAPLLPAERGRKARPARDNRLMLEAMLWRLRVGAPWRDVPDGFGPWESVYTRFSRWSRQGIWQRALKELTRQADEEWLMLTDIRRRPFADCRTTTRAVLRLWKDGAAGGQGLQIVTRRKARQA